MRIAMTDELKDITLRELLLWLIRRRQRVQVTGNSMLPLLNPGDEVLVDQRAYRYALPQASDIVIAQHPQRTDLRLIKRVVSITKDGRYILKGDNPLESTDSRTFGTVTVEQILGRVTCRFS